MKCNNIEGREGGRTPKPTPGYATDHKPKGKFLGHVAAFSRFFVCCLLSTTYLATKITVRTEHTFRAMYGVITVYVCSAYPLCTQTVLIVDTEHNPSPTLNATRVSVHAAP